MQLNCRILDSRLICYDEDTLTGSECVVGEDTDTVMSNEIESTVMKAKTHVKKHLEV